MGLLSLWRWELEVLVARGILAKPFVTMVQGHGLAVKHPRVSVLSLTFAQSTASAMDLPLWASVSPFIN